MVQPREPTYKKKRRGHSNDKCSIALSSTDQGGTYAVPGLALVADGTHGDRDASGCTLTEERRSELRNILRPLVAAFGVRHVEEVLDSFMRMGWTDISKLDFSDEALISRKIAECVDEVENSLLRHIALHAPSDKESAMPSGRTAAPSSICGAAHAPCTVCGRYGPFLDSEDVICSFRDSDCEYDPDDV